MDSVSDWSFITVASRLRLSDPAPGGRFAGWPSPAHHSLPSGRLTSATLVRVQHLQIKQSEHVALLRQSPFSQASVKRGRFVVTPVSILLTTGNF